MSSPVIASPDPQVWWLLDHAPWAKGEVCQLLSPLDCLRDAPPKEILRFGKPLEDWLL